MAASAANNAHKNRPQDSAFKQQRLKAWQPILTPKWVIGTFLVLTILFIVIGAIVLDASMSVKEQSVRYDNIPQCEVTCNDTACVRTQPTASCDVTFTIKEDMPAPVYFYYELSNFYQNHRRYVKSRSDEQLRTGNPKTTANCDPLSSQNGQTLYPCGLIAGSFFSDNLDLAVSLTPIGGGASADLLQNCKIPALGTGTYDLDLNWDDNSGQCQWVKKGIAWTSDVDKKFGKDRFLGNFNPGNNVTRQGPQQLRTKTYMPFINDEDLIVWMRTAGLPTFKKLKRVINRDLMAGDQLTIKVDPNYDVAQFGGSKRLVLSTTSWLGGRNDFLGIAYLTVGCICALLVGGFTIKHVKDPRKLGSMEYFDYWQQSRN